MVSNNKKTETPLGGAVDHVYPCPTIEKNHSYTRQETNAGDATEKVRHASLSEGVGKLRDMNKNVSESNRRRMARD